MKKVRLVTTGNKTKIEGKGDLFPFAQDKDGEIFLEIKGVDKKMIPVRLKAKGLRLSPDYPYTRKLIPR